MRSFVSCRRQFAAFLFLLLAGTGGYASEPLRERFLNPPDEAKPRGYWVWPHGNFDYSTIRKELESFKAKGLGGVDIFDLGVKDRKDVIPPGPGFMSVEQVDGIAFALAEAKRLGLKLGLIVSSSWNAGGTWTKPEHAYMNLVAWKETVTGPTRYQRVLPFPELPETSSKSYGTFPLTVPRDDAGKPLFYEDVAVIAYQVDEAGVLTDTSRVLVLGDRIDRSGKLVCDLPAGRWVLMRTVLTNFGQPLWLPSDKSQGMTMDHFSKEATKVHFQTIIDRLEQRVGPLENTALERLYLASYEANADVDWTPGFGKSFRTRNGYAIEPFLPALFGTLVVDTETTDRFLYDYRETVSEMFLDNLYREASRICRQHGLVLCSESGGPGAPLHNVPTEDLKALGAVDVMRGEFWVDKSDRLDDNGLETLQVVKQIASAAHIYGHKIVEMEAFTSHESWQEGPDLFKRLADRAFCEGMTRVVYHTMSHNLREAGKPGWTYQAGSHMSTNLTWWDMSDQLHTYLTRCSGMLMQGEFVADVAYYLGGEVPNFAKPKHLRPDLGFGYDYDDLNTEVLLTATVNDEGQVELPSGMKYRLLVLPDDDRMSLEVVRQIKELLLAGAAILGPKPERTYGLRNFRKEEELLRAVADDLWGDVPRNERHERVVERGRLFVGHTTREVLKTLGVEPDLTVLPGKAESQIDFIHRRTGTDDIYFVRNTSDQPLRCDIIFRVSSRRPEFWDAATGEMSELAMYANTASGMRVPFDLPPHGSRFVVFPDKNIDAPFIEAVERDQEILFPIESPESSRGTATWNGEDRIRFQAPEGNYTLHLSNGNVRTARVPAAKPSMLMEGTWELRFPLGWGVPTRQAVESLQSWTDFADPQIQHFSGIATYAQQFHVDGSRVVSGQTVLLDLGEVREVARVYLNGQEVGISSFAPHVLNVSDVVRPGENSLIIEIANTWLNRLIADDALPESERRTHTNLDRGPALGVRSRDATPKPSGLLGPVKLVFPSETIVDSS